MVLLGGLLGILNSTMAAVATDTLAKAFDTSLSTAGWTSTGFLLAVTATIPFTTWAVDRFGGKRLWLIGLVVFVAGSIAAGLAWNVGSLIAFRTLQGVGAGILDPLVLILLARAAGPHRAGQVMGLMGVVLSLGPVLGPIAGGAVLAGLSWRWMFLLSVPVGVIAYGLARRVLPNAATTRQPAGVRLDVLGLALLGPGFAAVVLALSESAEQNTFLAGPALVPLTAGAVLLIGYAVHALRVRRTAPLIDLRLFTSRGFTASVTIMGIGGLANFATLFALPLYYQHAHEYGVFATGLLIAPAGLGGAIAMPLAGRLSDQIGARGLAAAGAAVAAASGLAFTRIGADTALIWPILGAFAMGLGIGCFSAPTMGSLYRTLPPAMVAQGSSVLYMLNQLGAALGVALVAFVLQTASGPITGFRGVFWLAVAMMAIVLAVIPLLSGRPEKPAVPGELATSGRPSR
ncbi:DHA2 family efflux MFS transporter permease subunit [Phytohabitans flavus]|uniref:DHA2 family efflux MFS transporter permease subunit n=1 Tax=Phytohabitans flavus TaxID=1076124 RepID=UPI0018D8D8C2|nr:DHA2 family efflux MFS transporter permease subunit [Phytohabitans flavus]